MNIDSQTTPTHDEVSAPTPPTPTDPFDPARLRVSATSDEALGVERPLLNVPVTKAGKQSFFRAHPSPDMTILVRIIDLKDQGEVFLLTPEVAEVLYGESRLVALTTCITRQGLVFLWPVPVSVGGERENAWNATARQAAEIATTKWVRMQSNRAAGQYDVTTSVAIPEPVWPKHTLPELLRIAFGGDRLIQSLDHPVVRQLSGQV
jgi:hypothetical protein